tara:strand:+ start:2391 stop:2699 length:309 start_codon:yes stop_codon:yes gene_type:complete
LKLLSPMQSLPVPAQQISLRLSRPPSPGTRPQPPLSQPLLPPSRRPLPLRWQQPLRPPPRQPQSRLRKPFPLQPPQPLLKLQRPFPPQLQPLIPMRLPRPRP